MLKEKTSCDEVAGDTTGSKKQLQLTPQLKIWLANLLTPLIDSEEDPDDKIMLNAPLSSEEGLSWKVRWS